MTENTSVKKEFGSSFEEKILQAILSDPRFGEQIIEVLSPELFDSDYLQDMAELVKEYYFKYDDFPTLDIMEAVVKQKISDEVTQSLCSKYLKKIQKTPLNGDFEYVKENSLKYFRTQHLKNILLDDVIPRIHTANFDEVVPIMEKAMQMGTDKNIGYDYFEDETERFQEDVFETISTPWSLVNEYLDGGWGAKRLATIIGASGAGKSHMLVNTGFGALMEGKVVVHYTLELSELDVARRYDARASGVEINHIVKNKVKVLASLKKKFPQGARLIIKEYPMKSASVQTVKAHLARLRLKGITPDLIVIDYGDLMKPVEAHKESRHGLQAVWIDLKSLAQEFSIPVITATQTNRTGYNSDVITADQVAEDFSKIMTSDIIITMARNMEQKAAGVGKMHMAKNRQGEDGQIFCYQIHTATSFIDCFPLTGDEEDELSNAVKEEDSLAHKLNKYLQEKKSVVTA